MVASDHLDNLEMRVQELTAELEKANKVIRDEIFERKRIENELIKLKKSEEKYRRLFKAMQEAFFIADIITDKTGKPADYRIIEANRAIETQTGVPLESFIGNTALGMYPGLDPFWIETYGRVALTGKPEHFNYYADVQGRHYEVSAYQIRPGRFAAIFLDITDRKRAEKALQEAYEQIQAQSEELQASNEELKVQADELKQSSELLRESEEKYRMLFEAMQEGFFIADIITDETGEPVDYLFVDANKALEAQTGFSLKYLIGKTALEIHPNLDSFWPQTYGHVALTGKPVRFDHYSSVQRRYYEVSAYQIRLGRFAAFFLDINDRKQAEEALIRSEKEFRTLAENSPDLITRFDRENRHIYANPAAMEAYGRKLQDIIGKTHGELERNPKQVKFWEEHYQKVFATGKPETIEVRYISPQGKKYYFNTRIVPEFTNDKVSSVLSISRNINDIKEAEARLRDAHDNLEKLVEKRTSELEKAYISLEESRKSLAEAQEMVHLGNWDRNLVTNKLYWSDEFYRIFGLNPQEISPTYDIFLSFVHQDDREYVDNTVKGALNGKAFEIDYRIILADGEERVVHAQGEAIFNEQKIPVRIRGTIQDTTERKKAEEKIQSLARIVESSNDAIITKSLDGIITNWNKGAEQVYGYSAEEILGKPVSILVPPHLDKEVEKLNEIVKQGEKIQQYETLRLRKDGKVICVSITLSPIFDIRRKLTAISVIARDITERKEAEESLARAEVARQKEIHHRIKNNLQVISSLLDLQAEKFKNIDCANDSEILEAFRESQDRVVSIALIHEELYEGEGTDTLNFSLYLQKLAKGLFQTYKVGNSDISLKTDLEKNIFFDMDTAVPLGMIVNELVSNSLKHAFPGRKSGEIRIKLSREESPRFDSDKTTSLDENHKSTAYTLTVSDNGTGIPESINIEDSDTLGIQLVTILVDQLDGKLELNRDSGTEFVIRFAVLEKQ